MSPQTGVLDPTGPTGLQRPGRRWPGHQWSGRQWSGRRVWRVGTGVGVWAALVAVTGWTVVRLLGLERGLGVQLVAFTPYVAVGSLAPLGAALALRRWRAAAVAAALAGVLAGCVVPRWTADSGAATAASRGGPTIRVMTANLLEGGADPARIVGLVRGHRVDVLAVQEYTEQSRLALGAAGLEQVLPNLVAFPEPGVTGSALYSRFPLTDGVWHRHAASGFGQAAAVLTVPGGAPVAIESAHPCAPSDPALDPVWRSDHRELAPATPDGTVRILLGDFNATLDHAVLRRLLGTGYRDAADVVGAGLVPSWPYDGRFVPRVTIDHVLADRRVGVRTVSVHRIPRTDHRAVVAELVLPPG